MGDVATVAQALQTPAGVLHRSALAPSEPDWAPESLDDVNEVNACRKRRD